MVGEEHVHVDGERATVGIQGARLLVCVAEVEAAAPPAGPPTRASPAPPQSYLLPSLGRRGHRRHRDTVLLLPTFRVPAVSNARK